MVRESVVVLRNLWKIYRMGETSVEALRGVDLRVRRGEYVAVLGPSGSGKSTLLNIIGGLDRPTEGLVFVNGENLRRLSESRLARFRARNIGFVFQFFNLIPTFTVLENVMVPAEILGLGREEARRRAEIILRIVGLEDKIHNFPSQLSGGEQQRAAIARAFVNEPVLLLCDEPTGNLDTRTGASIVRLLMEANRRYGITLIVVTHDRRIADSADRVVNLVDGKIVGEYLCSHF
ncbi:ABC transporter ATP-binding protein [Candidatus Bathyarchaeota archaeon]|nr:MAG: ABC transporter ATP-binding protein [Candidatus Bathyarchaeota archaeon]